MSLELQLTGSAYLLLAGILGAIVGMERERRHKSAGLRTHMLVCMGACLFSLLSVWAFPNGDPTRVASNIVTGVGFLGAGVIVKNKGAIHDLTTAANIWATAAIGMAVGLGAWFLALCGTLIMWLVLAVLWRLPVRERPSKYHKRKSIKDSIKADATTSNERSDRQ